MFRFVVVGLIAEEVYVQQFAKQKNARAEQINVKIFLMLITASSQVKHIFSFDIMELITVFSLRAVVRVLSNNTCH